MSQFVHELYKLHENGSQQNKPLPPVLTMVWMRPEADSAVPAASPPDRGGWGVFAWVAVGLAGLWLVVQAGGSWVMAAMATLIWGCAFRVWWRRDEVRRAVTHLPGAAAAPTTAAGTVPAPTAASAPTSASEPCWAQWVTGWYWQTDEQHRLTVLRPGPDLPDWLALDWPSLAAALAQRPVLTSLWQDETALGQLAYHLAQRQAWAGVLSLPWPDALPGWQLAQGRTGPGCRLMGAARLAPDGAWMGFHGVLVPHCDPLPAPAGEALGDKVMQQIAQEELQLRHAEQEVLRYALSHDLRAPLRVIDGFTRIVKEDYAGVLDKVGVDHLDRVLAASARMNGMIDAVLAQAQLAAEPVARSPVDLSALAREVATDLGALRDNKSPPVEWRLAEGLTTEADAGLVRRVLENLLGNALKYSAKVDQPCIEFGAMPATNPPVYFVRDNGAGFDMQHADKLFGMFQRLHSAKEFPGTGVGLAGVQAIVRRHGGRIWAEARPGQGACFYFTLMDIAQAQRRGA